MKKTHNKLIKGIKVYFKKNKINKAVIGLSGGIDSALSAKLVADAIGKKNIHALIMPVKGLSSEENIKDAVEFCKSIGISYSLIYINDFIKKFQNLKWQQSKIAKMNTASRIRAVILYNYANTHNALVIGTSNKTEIMLGYFTKYGDGAVDIEVIGDLYKTEVIELAKYLKIPNRIIEKKPTAELYHGQTDEGELGASYEDIDNILKTIGKKQKIGKSNFFEKIFKKIKNTEHKREQPKIIRINKTKWE
jgi:NAD+ synthase